MKLTFIPLLSTYKKSTQILHPTHLAEVFNIGMKILNLKDSNLLHRDLFQKTPVYRMWMHSEAHLAVYMLNIHNRLVELNLKPEDNNTKTFLYDLITSMPYHTPHWFNDLGRIIDTHKVYMVHTFPDLYDFKLAEFITAKPIPLVPANIAPRVDPILLEARP